jgi:hypothetical protein
MYFDIKEGCIDDGLLKMTHYGVVYALLDCGYAHWSKAVFMIDNGLKHSFNFIIHFHLSDTNIIRLRCQRKLLERVFVL